LGIIAQMLVRVRKNQPIQGSLRFNLAFQLENVGPIQQVHFPGARSGKPLRGFPRRSCLNNSLKR
jgi:hypothetical protein